MVSDRMICRILLLFSLFSLIFLNIHAQTNSTPGQIRPALQILDSTKEQDGLVGSVRRVRTEYAKITIKEGHPIEGSRQLLEVTTYGVKGNRVENVSYPINDSAVGREEYKYDDHGNIIEKVLRDDGGAVLSREAYDYVFDDVGNWTKMVTSLVVIENGELKREPTEVTYRTLTYYARETIPRTVARAVTGDVKSESGTARSETPAETAANGVMTANPAKANEVQTLTQSSTAVEKKAEPAPGNTSGSTSSSTVDTSTAPVAETAHTNGNGSGEKALTNQESSEVTNAPTASPEPGVFKSAKKAKSEARSTIVDPAAQSEPPKDNEAEKPAASNHAQPATESAVGTSVSRNTSSSAAEPREAIKTPVKLKSSPDPSGTSSVSESTESASAASSATLTKALEFYRLGRQRFEAGDVNSAIEAYLESVRLEPNSAEIQMNLGHAYLTAKKDKDAVKAFKEAVRLNPELTEAHYGLGFVSFRLTRYKDAMEAFKKATVLTPDMAKAHYGLALTYQELGKLDLLVQEQRLLQRLDPKLANKLVQAFTDVDFSCRGGAARYCH